MLAARAGDWMQTSTGRQFWPLDPKPEEIDIQDIAHALSNVCRFTGHVCEFYSVAEHSVRVSWLVEDSGGSASDVLWGLLHDASEAYLSDVARPVKPYLDNYYEIEAGVMAAVCKRFGLPPDMPELVHVADNRLLMTEARDLLGPHPAPWGNDAEPIPNIITPWPPSYAKSQFLARYRELTAS